MGAGSASSSPSLPQSFHATHASAQQLRAAGRMNHLSTIPPKTTKAMALSSTRLNKRVRPGASRTLEKTKEDLGQSQAFPHLQPMSLCREQHGKTHAAQTKGKTNTRGDLSVVIRLGDS